MKTRKINILKGFFLLLFYKEGIDLFIRCKYLNKKPIKASLGKIKYRVNKLLNHSLIGQYFC